MANKPLLIGVGAAGGIALLVLAGLAGESQVSNNTTLTNYCPPNYPSTRLGDVANTPWCNKWPTYEIQYFGDGNGGWVTQEQYNALMSSQNNSNTNGTGPSVNSNPPVEQNYQPPVINGSQNPCPDGIGWHTDANSNIVCDYQYAPDFWDELINPEENASLTPEEIWDALTREQQEYFWDLYAIAQHQKQGEAREDNKYTYNNSSGFGVDNEGNIISNAKILNQALDDGEQTQQVVTWKLDSQTYASLV